MKDQIVKGLEICLRAQSCKTCPYYGREKDCFTELARDLLKYLKTEKSFLREDEKSYTGGGRANYVCGRCGKVVGTWQSGLPLSMVFRYCPYCGRKITKIVRDDE